MAYEGLSGYLTKVQQAKREHPEWRNGQAHFIVLTQERMDIARVLWSTDVDPFHDDDRIPAFLTSVGGMW
jgi:hypothetical protein